MRFRSFTLIDRFFLTNNNTKSFIKNRKYKIMIYFDEIFYFKIFSGFQRFSKLEPADNQREVTVLSNSKKFFF